MIDCFSGFAKSSRLFNITPAAVVERTKTLLQLTCVHTGDLEQIMSYTRLHFSCEVFWGICKQSQVLFYLGKMFHAVKRIKDFLSEFSYSHSLLLAQQSIPLAMDQPCRWTVGREPRPKNLTTPDLSWLDSLSLQKKEDQHKTSEKQNLEQSAFSEY